MADMPAPVEVLSFGCRLNLVESEVIRREAAAAGRANLVVVNSCAVTAEAVKQARQSIRRIKRDRPEAEIIVTGCAAETERGTFAAMPEVTGIIGNAAKTRATSWRIGASPAPADIMAVSGPAPVLADTPAGHTRCFVQVQTGCDHRCTFCIIPFGRGNSRSVPLAEVVATIAARVEDGVPEVVLTGVDLTSWGHDLGEGRRLGDLVQAILAGVPGLRRLRLSSIDSIEADPALIEAIASEPRLMPHLHLSLQAGDDLILKRMKRRHSREDAIRFCVEIRARRPEIVFGADIIAGFPTETEAMFSQSLALVEDCGLTHLHVFPFSPRPGTPAARMPQQPSGVARERAARLRTAGEAALQRHLERQRGRTLEVLTENGSIGRSADFTPVRLAAGTPPGRFQTVTITGHDGRHLTTGLVAAAAAE
jgi:threonylcarbamoyladenosine tRNA methylthiotransferase MtaB